MKKSMKPSFSKSHGFFSSPHAIERYLERVKPGCKPQKAGEALARRARHARPLPSVAEKYARGVLRLCDGQLVMVVDMESRTIITCYPYQKDLVGGAQ